VKNLIVGLIVIMLVVPVSIAMIIEPQILGIGDIQPDYNDDELAPSSGMKAPRVFVFFHNDSSYCKGWLFYQNLTYPQEVYAGSSH